MNRALLLLAVCAAGCAKGADKAARKEGASDPGNTGVTPDRKDDRGGPGSSEPIVGGVKGGVDLEAILGGELEISVGTVSKDAVRRVMKDNVTKLQYCYEKTLLANPGIEGRVMAKFTIEPEGGVADVKCAGVHPDVEACVEEAVKAMRFPPQSSKVEVQYPFTFKPA